MAFFCFYIIILGHVTFFRFVNFLPLVLYLYHDKIIMLYSGWIPYSASFILC